jgi:hypothetical protein
MSLMRLCGIEEAKDLSWGGNKDGDIRDIECDRCCGFQGLIEDPWRQDGVLYARRGGAEYHRFIPSFFRFSRLVSLWD